MDHKGFTKQYGDGSHDVKLPLTPVLEYLANQPLLAHSERGSVGVVSIPRQKLSFFLQGWFVTLLILVMIIVAVFTEYVLRISEKNQGWQTGNLGQFGGINFLKSLIPVVLTLPISMLWLSVDQEMQKMHPFVVLAKGGAPASRSLLLDYTSGRFWAIVKSLKYRHWVIFFSSLVCMGNLVLSPLASGLLTTKSTVILDTGVPLTSIRMLGLTPDYRNLEFFVAASGYASAAAIHNLTDPPFLFRGSWAIAEFNIPSATGGAGSNQTVYLTTTGVETTSNCELADSQNVIDDDTGSGNITVLGSWSGCNVSFQVTDTESDQYGVRPLDNCQVFLQPPPYQPVIFYAYSFEKRMARLTFCQPSIQLYNLVAGVDMHTGLINNVSLIDQNVPQSNVSGLPAFNGINFNLTGADSYVNARAMSTQSAVPFAIYQGATNQPGGVSQVIQLEDGFLNLTTTVYTRFLALAAKSVYFVATSQQMSGEIQTTEIRLWVYPLAAHLFSGSLVLIAILAGITHIFHVRARRNVFLTCDPSTLAGAVSMTSHSKFPKLLHAGMDEDDLYNALRGMTFGISRRTWQVVSEAEEDRA
ncbi:hypothetical protein FRB95_000958 [Tulasnella sp. JGI-2019a]|nr:hypothetical protein FRB95_000958 [Tulasnella sp. JGI-2019a]